MTDIDRKAADTLSTRATKSLDAMRAKIAASQQEQRERQLADDRQRRNRNRHIPDGEHQRVGRLAVDPPIQHQWDSLRCRDGFLGPSPSGQDYVRSVDGSAARRRRCRSRCASRWGTPPSRHDWQYRR